MLVLLIDLKFNYWFILKDTAIFLLQAETSEVSDNIFLFFSGVKSGILVSA